MNVDRSGIGCFLGFAIQSLILGVFCLFGGCAPQPFGFSTDLHFRSQGFTSEELFKAKLVVMPLVTSGGIDTTKQLEATALYHTVQKVRPDLQLISLDRLDYTLKESGKIHLAEFLNNIYNENYLKIQSSSLLDSTKCDYFITLRLKYGIRVVSMQSDVKRRTIIEGELWDCKKKTVVWRVVVRGICAGATITDSDFILRSIIRIYQEIPVPDSRSYGKQQW